MKLDDIVFDESNSDDETYLVIINGNGEVHEHIKYRNNLTDKQQEEIRQYIIDKFGLML